MKYNHRARAILKRRDNAAEKREQRLWLAEMRERLMTL